MRRAAATTILLLTVVSGCRQAPSSSKRPLESVSAIRAMSEPQLRSGLPVRFTGSVIYWEPRSRLLIVSDQTGGILVDRLDPRLEVGEGTKVSVEGYTGYESFAPVVVKAAVSAEKGSWRLPATPVAARDVLAGRYEHQLVEVTAVLESFSSFVADETRAVFRLDGVNVNGVVLKNARGVLDRFMGKEVAVKCVPVVRRTPTGGVYEVELLVSSGYEVTRTAGASGPANNPPIAANKALPILTSIHAIKSLTSVEAEKRYPVRVRGVALDSETMRGQLTIHDGKEGVYVFTPVAAVQNIKRGDEVEITGFTDPGGFAPAIVPTESKVLGVGTLPEPVRLTPESVTPTLDNAWVEVPGIVRFVRKNAFDYPVLRVNMGRWLFEAEVLSKQCADAMGGMIDSKVAIRGVWSPLYDNGRQLRGFRLFVPGPEFIKVIERMPPLPDTRRIIDLRAFAAERNSERRVRVAGMVTASRMNGELWIQDETGGVELQLSAPPGKPVPAGSFVQATGVLPPVAGRPLLEEVNLKPAEARPALQAARISAEDCGNGDADARLVKVDGYLTDVDEDLGDIVLSLRSGRTDFRGVLESPSAYALPSDLRNGSLLELTGVCKVDWSIEGDRPQAQRVNIVLGSAGDIRVLQASSWWTREHTLGVLLGVTGVTLVIMAWSVLLGRKVRRQGEVVRTQMEREVQLQSQLEQARRLESIGRLAGGIAHDFNNLLTVILGYADVLAKGGVEEQKARDYNAQVVKAASRAAQLTQQLLAYSRRQALQPRVLDLNREIRDAVSLLERVIDESVQLDLRLRDNLPCIRVDPSQFHQVLINLVANARDAMPGGGKLTIETSETNVDADTAKRSQIDPGVYVRLTLSDTGMGMDEQTAANIFEPFFTTKGLGKGTGLGLATVYGIVKQSGGHIWVYSKPGMGSTFKLQFPATREPLPAAVPKPQPARRGGGRTILLVEDQEDVRKLTAQILRESGYAVVEASCGEEALQIAADEARAFDLLLVDAVLPGINGRQVADALMAKKKGLRILYMSGYTENVVVARGQLKAGIRLLEKPFTRDQLLKQVQEALSVDIAYGT